MNIRIPVKRKKPSVFFVAALVITLLLVLNLIYDMTAGKYLVSPFDWIFNSLILLPPLFYTTIMCIEFIRIRLNINASLVVSECNLYDSLGIFSLGAIDWQDIADADIMKIYKRDVLVIKLQNPDKYLVGKTVIELFFLRNYIKRCGGPVIIPQERINYDLHQLKDIIMTFRLIQLQQPFQSLS